VYFTQLIELEPMNPRGYLGAAEAYIGPGDLAGAESILKEGAQNFPDTPDIQRVLAQIDLLEGEATPEPMEEAAQPTQVPTSEPTEAAVEYITIQGVQYSMALTELDLREKTWVMMILCPYSI